MRGIAAPSSPSDDSYFPFPQSTSRLFVEDNLNAAEISGMEPPSTTLNRIYFQMNPSPVEDTLRSRMRIAPENPAPRFLDQMQVWKSMESTDIDYAAGFVEIVPSGCKRESPSRFFSRELLQFLTFLPFAPIRCPIIPLNDDSQITDELVESSENDARRHLSYFGKDCLGNLNWIELN